jgi:integrase/recombinase XerD
MSARVLTPSNRCPPVPEWPLRDQADWAAALQPCVEPDQISVAAHWSAATRRMVVGGYGRWLTWQEEEGPRDALTPAAEYVTPERVSRYMADLSKTVAAFTLAARVEQLGNAMRAMAPDRNWHWLQHLADQIRRRARAERKRTQVPSPPVCSQDDADPRVALGSAALAAMSNRCLPFAEWPTLDQAPWTASLQPGDVLEPGGVASRWALASQGLVINGYGRWLTWLTGRGGLDPLLPPSARVTRERLLAYAKDLEATVSPFTVATRIEQVGNAMRAIAPETDWRWIQRAADRIRVRAVPVRDKRSRLQSPKRLVALGMALMRQADNPATGSPAVRGATYRDGLMIALLALRPMRRRNLAALLCDQHLLRRGSQWWVELPAQETKTGQAQQFPFPDELVPGLDRYLQHHRPVLLGLGQRQATPVTALWVSKHGTHMGYAAVGHQVSQRTAAAFGKSLSPHLFRDCTATTIAISAPQHIGIVKPLLGHTTLATSERHYNLAGSLEASRRYNRAIEDLRRLATTPQRMPPQPTGFDVHLEDEDVHLEDD